MSGTARKLRYKKRENAGSNVEAAFGKIAGSHDTVDKEEFNKVLIELGIRLDASTLNQYCQTIDKKGEGITLAMAEDWIPTIRSSASSAGEATSLEMTSLVSIADQKSKYAENILDALASLDPAAVESLRAKGGDVVVQTHLPRDELGNSMSNSFNNSSENLTPRSQAKGQRRSATQKAFLDSIRESSSTPVKSNEQVFVALPFVSNLAVTHKQHGKEAAKVLFCTIAMVDISGFSKISSFLQKQGYSPYVMSGLVNQYLEKILAVVEEYGGDVVNFAGDAVTVLWYSENPSTDATLALGCALDLQERCESFRVFETSYYFTMHIGLDCGNITSTILSIKQEQLSPSAFHLLFGPPITAVTDACSKAVSGQVCATATLISHLCPNANPALYDKDDRMPIVEAMNMGLFVGEIFKPGRAPRVLTDEGDAQDFVPIPVFRKINGGINKFFLSELRNLTVIFVGYSEKRGGDVGSWFWEVASLAFSHDVDIVQVLDSEKGTHIVAACNLYTMNESAGDNCIQFAKNLREHRVRCHIGVASGQVLCGVVGSAGACRWDITGASVVRACRLMEYAKQHGLAELFDSSILKNASDHSLLQAKEMIAMKGSSSSHRTFCLIPDSSASHRSMDLHFTHRLCGNVHRDLINNIRSIVADRGSEDVPATILLKGPFGCGKFSLALNALNSSRFVPVVHLCNESNHKIPLCILETLAGWFVCSDNTAIHELAHQVLTEHKAGHYSQASDIGLDLMRSAVDAHKNIALIVRRGQLLDINSLAFMGTLSKMFAMTREYISFFCWYPIFGSEHPDECFAVYKNVKSFSIEYVTEAECRALVDHELKSQSSRELSSFVFRKTEGHVECIIELMGYLTHQGFLKVQRDGSTTVSSQRIVRIEQKSWTEISTILPAKTLAILDRLPVNMFFLLKIACSITQQEGVSAYFPIMSSVLVRIMKQELVDADVGYLEKLMLLRLTRYKWNPQKVQLDSAVFYHLPMRDVVQDLQVPEQHRLINRICAMVFSKYHTMDHPLLILTRARHYLYAEEFVKARTDVHDGWKLLHEREFADPAIVRRRFIETLAANFEMTEAAKMVNLDENAIRDISVMKYATSDGTQKDLDDDDPDTPEYSSRSSKSSRSSMGGSMGGSSWSDGANSETTIGDILTSLKKNSPPVALGPLAEHYPCFVKALSGMYDFVEHAQAMGEEIIGGPDATFVKAEQIPIFFISSLVKSAFAYQKSLKHLQRTIATVEGKKTRDDEFRMFKSITVIVGAVYDADFQKKDIGKMFVDVVQDFSHHAEIELPAILQEARKTLADAGDKGCSADIWKLLPRQAEILFPSILQALSILAERGDIGNVLYVVFESLPDILALCDSDVRRTAFCNSLFELSKASRGMPCDVPEFCAYYRSFLLLWTIEVLQ